MTARRRRRRCGRTNCQHCEVHPANHLGRWIKRVDIKVSVDLAKVFAALTALTVMLFHQSK